MNRNTVLAINVSSQSKKLDLLVAKGGNHNFSVITRLNAAQSKVILETIICVIDGAALNLPDLDLFVVQSESRVGTGFRVGLASIKGLASSLGKPYLILSLEK